MEARHSRRKSKGRLSLRIHPGPRGKRHMDERRGGHRRGLARRDLRRGSRAKGFEEIRQKIKAEILGSGSRRRKKSPGLKTRATAIGWARGLCSPPLQRRGL